MSLRSQLRKLTGSDLSIVGRARAEALKDHVAEYNRDSGQHPRVATTRTASGVEVEYHLPTITIEPTSNALAEAFSERLPTPREHLLQTQALQSTSVNSRSGSLSNSSQSLTEDDIQSTNGTSHAAQVSPPGTDDWELEGENWLDQTYIHARDFRRFDKWRLKLVSRQLRLREQRKVLRRQRVFISEQQGEVLQELRTLVFKGGERDLEHLLKRLQEIQKLLEKLQNQEEQYDRDEKFLIDEEWKVRDAEEKLLRQQTQRPSAQRSEHELHLAESQAGALPAATASLYSETGTLIRQNPPSLSELQTVRARLEKLKSEHLQLLEEEKLRTELGLELDQDSIFALRVFPLRQAELLHYLDFYEEQVAERQAIFDDSFDQFPVYQYTGHDLEVLAQETSPGTMSDMFATDADNTLVSHNRTNSQDTLMRWDNGSEEENVEIFPCFAASKENTVLGRLLFINDWFLHIIRCSSFALFQLKVFLQDATESLAPQDFKITVLSFWYHDETSMWYLASMEREAASLNSTALLETQSKTLQTALSDHNLLMMRKRMELRGQSRSLLARSSEVKDLADNFQGVGLVD